MKALLLYRGGICSAKRELADGQEHTLFFKAKTPLEVSQFSGAETRWENASDKSMEERERRRAAFIASSLCEEDGKLLMTETEAMLIPATLKPELCSMILKGSGETGDAKKD